MILLSVPEDSHVYSKAKIKGGDVGGVEVCADRTSGQVGGHDSCGAEWEHTPPQGMLLLHQSEWHREA